MSSLWRDRPFLTYWAATSVFQVGAQVTLVALPLVAVLTLHAGAAQTGLLRASVALPSLLFGLFAGVWVDRHRRRPLMISANLAAAASLATIPLAATLHLLTIGQVFLVAFLVGTCDLFGFLAAVAFLPVLIGRDRLVDANSKLATSSATIQIIGPSLAGLLVQLVTAPFAIVAECVSNVVSAGVLSRIRRSEPPLIDTHERNLARELGQGLQSVWRSLVLRMVLLISASFNLFSAMAQAVLVLFMARELRLPAFAIGLVFAASGPGALVGALLSRRLSKRMGAGPAIVSGGFTFGLGWALAPLAGGSPLFEVVLLMTTQFLLHAGAQVVNVNASSLRQAVTPDHLMGRVGGTISLASQGVIPIGAVAGGFIGQQVGLRAALGLAAAGTLIAMAYLGISPFRRIKTPDDAVPIVYSSPA